MTQIHTAAEKSHAIFGNIKPVTEMDLWRIRCEAFIENVTGLVNCNTGFIDCVLCRMNYPHEIFGTVARCVYEIQH